MGETASPARGEPVELAESVRRALTLLGSTVAAIAITALSVHLALTDAMRRTLREVAPRVDLRILALVFPLTIVLNLVRAVRFTRTLGVGGPGALRKMFEINGMLVFLGLMLPFKAGELSFPVMTKRAFDHDYTASLATLAYTRVTDLLAVVALGGFALSSLWREGTAATSVAGRLAFPCAVGSALALVALPSLLARAHALGRRLTKSPRVHAILERLFDGCRRVAAPRDHAVYLGLTLLVWGILASTSWLSMVAMGVTSSLRDGLLANTASSITFALPVSGVAGIGPVQASWAYALTLVGWSWESAVANALLSHAAMIVCGALLSLMAVVSRALRSRDAAERAPE